LEANNSAEKKYNLESPKLESWFYTICKTTSEILILFLCVNYSQLTKCSAAAEFC